MRLSLANCKVGKVDYKLVLCVLEFAQLLSISVGGAELALLDLEVAGVFLLFGACTMIYTH